MFKRLIRIELHRAFYSKGMKISLGIGLILALEHFIFRVLPITELMFDEYHEDVAVSIIKNVHGSWMSGMISAESNIYETIVFLMITIPYAASFYLDKKNGVLKNVSVRGDKRMYLIAKSVAVFMSAGVTALFPLIINLMLTCTVVPVINYDWEQGMYPTALFVKVFLSNPILYYIIMFFIIFIFAGLVAGIALTVSLYANNVFIVMSFPFLIALVSSRLVTYSGNSFVRGLSLTKMFRVYQSSPSTIASMLTLALILLVVGYVTFIIKGEKRDVL